MQYNDALRGYAYPIHERDGFKCVYCGLNGTDWPAWLFLSQNHLLPKSHPLRDNCNYIVTACRFCNEACNRTRFDVEGKKPEEIIAVKKGAIMKVRSKYKQFYEQKVNPPSLKRE